MAQKVRYPIHEISRDEQHARVYEHTSILIAILARSAARAHTRRRRPTRRARVKIIRAPEIKARTKVRYLALAVFSAVINESTNVKTA